MTEANELAKKVDALIENANQLDDIKFRLILESMVKEGEEEVITLLIPYITAESIPAPTRMNIIRVAGYLQNSQLLVPLRKIITQEGNIRLKQEAIIAVSKFNDRRALNILNTALQNLNNPLLASTINREISRIKQNNPILGLLPRFMEGSKNPKTFKIALDVLKRILTPADATIFTKHLDMGDPMVEDGAFEILCCTGDIFHDTFIIDYFKKRFSQITCIGEPECEDLYWLIRQFQQYLSRYQFLVEEQIPMLKEQFPEVRDIRAQSLYIDIICRSRKLDTVEFMQDVFDEYPKLGIEIIHAFSGNETAKDFLFTVYDEEESLREEAIKSLLNTTWGINHFMENFFSLEFEVQELVTQHLPYSGSHDLVDFIRQIFNAKIFRLKEILLSKIKENYEFSVKDLLFAPEHEREFTFMGDRYIDTISELFPVSAVKDIFGKIVNQGLSVTKTKMYIQKVAEVVPKELLFTFRDREFIEKLFNRIVLSNNTELNLLFLGTLKYIKTLDTETYRVLTESLNLFISKREKYISGPEKAELRKIKQSLRDIFYEVKAIEDGRSEIERVFSEDVPDFEVLEKVLARDHMALVIHVDHFLKTISKHFEKAGPDDIPGWTRIFFKFPGIAQLLKESLNAKAHRDGGLRSNDLKKLVDSLPDEELRIVLNFKNRSYTAILQEQFRETVPHIMVTVNEEDTREDDLMLCDADALNDLILQSKVIPKKIYIFLEKAAAFAAFRSYNPRSFVQPFSFYRIIREILQHLYQ